ALVALFAFRPSLAPPAMRDFFTRHSSSGGDPGSSASASGVKSRPTKSTNAKTAAEAEVWASLHPDDLQGIVSRLRAAGFPPSVIRAVVSSLIAAQFAPRYRELFGTDDGTPAWKKGNSLFGPGDTKQQEQYSQLSRERSKLMRELLGHDLLADTSDATVAQRRQFGDIPRSKIDLLQRINDDYAEMTSQIRASMQGITLPEDREKLALLEREKHADLAAILTPEQLADYEMRTSGITTMLRSRMSAFDATEAEFRAIYQVQKSISDQFAAGGGMQVNPQLRSTLGQQYIQQMAAALSPERFAEFNRGMDRDYQQLTALGQRENLSAATLTQAYNVRDVVAVESNRIYDDSSLSAEQKRAQLATLAQQTRNQLLATLGPTVGQAYVRQLENSWLRTVENGAAVSFNGPPTGTSTNSSTGVTMFMGASGPVYKRVPAPRPPGAPAAPGPQPVINSGQFLLR
ncbi:MAG: hypothetical protein ABIR80_15385, partial [Opitutaceae bacterium]